MTEKTGEGTPMTPEARRLADEHRWLVQKIATKLVATGRARRVQEVIEHGELGLLEAAERFSSELGVPFQNYAWYRIEGAMRDGLRRNERKSRTCREAMEQSAGWYAANARGHQSTTFGRILQDLEDEAWGMIATRALAGVSQTVDPDPESALIAEQEWARTKQALAASLAELPERDRVLLDQHHRQGLSHQEIGARMSPPLARPSVTHRHRDALIRLGKRLRERGVEEAVFDPRNL